MEELKEILKQIKKIDIRLQDLEYVKEEKKKGVEIIRHSNGDVEYRRLNCKPTDYKRPVTFNKKEPKELLIKTKK